MIRCKVCNSGNMKGVFMSIQNPANDILQCEDCGTNQYRYENTKYQQPGDRVYRNMKKYSVLLLCPDYTTDHYGQDTFYTFVKAQTPEEAVEKAKMEVAKEDSERMDTNIPIDDYFLLLLLEGHHKDISAKFK